MKTCPACGSTLNKLTGKDGHQVVPVIDGSERKVLATIWTCPTCEHCEGGR